MARARNTAAAEAPAPSGDGEGTRAAAVESPPVEVTGADSAEVAKLRLRLDELQAEHDQVAAERDRLKAEANALVAERDEARRQRNGIIWAAEQELQAARAKIGQQAAEIEFLKDTAAAPTAPTAEAKAPPALPSRTARVSVPGTHFGSVVVNVAGDEPHPDRAAVELARQARGVTSFGAGPQVEWLD